MIVNAAFSQQMQQYTQYALNDFINNPAVAGVDDYFVARSNNRYQWVGVVDAPRTYTLSMYGPHKSKSMGFGGYLFSDFTGPTSRTGLYGSYAYNLKIVNNIRLSLGLTAGVLQYKIDGTKVTLKDDFDPLDQQDYIDYVPDAGFGAHLYSDKYYVGFSANQLLRNNINFYEDTLSGLNRLTNHFFVVAGYKFPVTDVITIEPSVLVKAMTKVPVQIDFSLKASYMKMAWFGVSYRTSDAIAFMIGYDLDSQLMIGYSYDMIISSVKKASSGSHEVMLGIRFNKARKTMPISISNE
ncbi:MAG: hypothetical protein A2265_05585 [Bacteroidetes bacterium RIFOXYA12_FULL_33_9]|nr:MAG: hypothetical protein A2265_05585 [Bacteroidetes bacterium RIFOXYA12_FULL_33_9]